MPSGGLMQLVSYGSEDLYLTGNPQITFFKVVYRRHTNFAYEWIPIYFKPTQTFNTTGTVTMDAPIPRQGDLVRDLALVMDLPDIFSSADENFKWIEDIGEILIDSASVTIGGQTIHKCHGQWINIWGDLTIPVSKAPGYDELIGNVSEMFAPPVYNGDIGTTTFPTIRKRRLRIPIPFWFTQHPGLAIPLIAIQYIKVNINVVFRALNDLFTLGIPAQSPSQLFNAPNSAHNIALRDSLVNQGFATSNVIWKFINGTNQPTGSWNQNVFIDMKYVFLDNPERRLFAAAVSEYLITQTERLEFTGLVGGPNTVDIDFFHPVKEMIWVFQRDDVCDRNQWTNYTTLPNNRDLPELIALNAAFDSATRLGLNPSMADFQNAVLPSGLTVTQFVALINCTDQLKLNVRNPDAFDQILNIMYFGEFIFNGHKRQEPKTIYYYQYQEPVDNHTSAPGRSKQIYVFSFAERPEMVQPSGSADFSRFWKPEFQFTIKSLLPLGVCTDDVTYNYSLFFYVRNINILRIMNGIAGLVFAN
jgi:hypothetical protein